MQWNCLHSSRQFLSSKHYRYFNAKTTRSFNLKICQAKKCHATASKRELRNKKAKPLLLPRTTLNYQDPSSN